MIMKKIVSLCVLKFVATALVYSAIVGTASAQSLIYEESSAESVIPESCLEAVVLEKMDDLLSSSKCNKESVLKYLNKCYEDTKAWTPDETKDGKKIGAQEIIEYCVCAAEDMIRDSLSGCKDKNLVINRLTDENGNTKAAPYVEIRDWDGVKGPYNGVSLKKLDCSKIAFKGPDSLPRQR